MSTILETGVPPTDTPALIRALPYVQSGATLIFSASQAALRTTFTAVLFLLKLLANPITFLSPFPILLYILAPLVVFVQLLLEIAVYAPTRTIAYAVDAIYPAYVFLGVACITGALIGLSGRLTVLGVLYVLPPTPPQLVVEVHEEKPRRIP
ncbi:hypothetical protein B0H17DRAFT_1011664 [Mycena rosella]|uniref:Uncharacterized protein n=1 Tax=Mycena rosella TaxID=1033263 RepID=A0AAD7CQK3_MYCRO|nr:hypothetical protein B0H17DRAFT_1021128 [Mycena rosella]KAJ7690254.1 hypothetical protein B0H17DRAFT_1011664 [Mycena rosella]